MAASRYREALGVDPAPSTRRATTGTCSTPTSSARAWTRSVSLVDVYRQIAIQLGQTDDLLTHPWYGVGNRDLQLFDKERVCAALSRWQEALGTSSGEAD